MDKLTIVLSLILTSELILTFKVNSLYKRVKSLEKVAKNYIVDKK